MSGYNGHRRPYCWVTWKCPVCGFPRYRYVRRIPREKRHPGCIKPRSTQHPWKVAR